MTVAIAAPLISHPKRRIMTGSRITFAMFPISMPIIAVFACPSARTTLEKQFEIRTNGPQAVTISM